MLKRLMVSAAVLALTGSAAIAGSIEPRKDFQVFKDVAASVDRYTQFTIFDDVSASVKDGVVTLTGKVTMPYKRSDIEKRVAKVNGVVTVRDQITVLPVSQFDDELPVYQGWGNYNRHIWTSDYERFARFFFTEMRHFPDRGSSWKRSSSQICRATGPAARST